MATDFSEMLSSLPSLTPGQLQTLKDRVDFLGTGKGANDAEVHQMSDFYTALLQQRNCQRMPPIYKVPGTPLYKKLRNTFEAVDSFIDKEFGDLRRIQKISLFTILMACAEKDLLRARAKITPSVLLMALSNPHKVFSNHFPGYLSNPMALQLILMKVGSNG